MQRSMMQADEIMSVLEGTSRTFYLPIARLPDGLREAVTSAYLCMRAIDEIEDHPSLDHTTKAELLQQISLAFQGFSYGNSAHIHKPFQRLLAPWTAVLLPVSSKLGTWAEFAPPEIAPSIWGATAAMADRMAYWASINWRIRNKTDLDAYTYSVAGAIGLLLCDILAWYDGTQMDRGYAVQFGRGLQMTNIARNRSEDLSRGVDFYPPGWTDARLRGYAASWLSKAGDYARSLPPAPFNYFIQIPLALAEATLDALGRGEVKLTREAVMETLAQLELG